ncbi:MAG: glycosyltransferase [Pseudomonadota bacterium]|nr:glycosyltransferase [Pseudomonadota bacterium]
MDRALRIVILGLTITSSWGNGHATTYRGLVRGLSRRGHQVLFLERDKPWYAENRDLAAPPYGETALYDSLDALKSKWAQAIASADLVIVGSYVPEGIEAGRIVQSLARGVTAFYDIDTPVTLSALETGSCDYLAADILRRFDLYLSFTGGPTLQELERRWGARAARALYCSADPDLYQPAPDAEKRWDLGYLGTYSTDRQPVLEDLLCVPAQHWPEGRFVVAGPLYPADLTWPGNVERIEHAAPAEHRDFYATQRFTLNVTRADMVRRGHSPSVRLFEAACCGTPIISDWWEGLDELFTPGEEILIARGTDEVLAIIRSMPEEQRVAIGAAGRARVLAAHTGDHRAAELEIYTLEALQAQETRRVRA